MTATCVRCAVPVPRDPEDGAPGVILSTTRAWCLDCLDAAPAADRSAAHDDAETAVGHRCEVDRESDTFYDDGGFCRYCGAHLSYIGGADLDK